MFEATSLFRKWKEGEVKKAKFQQTDFCKLVHTLSQDSVCPSYLKNEAGILILTQSWGKKANLLIQKKNLEKKKFRSKIL